MKDRITTGGRILHRNKCDQVMRNSFTNKFGDRVTLFGKHGYEWSVGVKRVNSCFMALTIFPQGRKTALDYYKTLCNEF